MNKIIAVVILPDNIYILFGPISVIFFPLQQHVTFEVGVLRVVNRHFRMGFTPIMPFITMFCCSFNVI